MRSFHLNKWYLDFVDEQGRAMIFYSAQLTWYGITINYGSWLDAASGLPVKLRQGFHGVRMPDNDGSIISYKHSGFGISGTWKNKGKNDGILARLIEMPEGHLDWHCYQPASEVTLDIDGKKMHGLGYAEQLILTIPPWKIPMKNLRWGRYVSAPHNIVWIQIDLIVKKTYLWLNGEQQKEATIRDSQIDITEKAITLTLDQFRILESEKKISSVVERLIKYIPGFKKAIPTQFLMADEHKWLSHGKLSGPDFSADGMAIHEYVNFQTDMK